MELDITYFVLLVVSAVFGLVYIVAGLFVYVRVFLAEKRRAVPEEWRWAVDDLVTVGVRAAEQVYRSQKDKAKAKLRYAVNFVGAEAKRRGYKIDEAQITTLIEAKVQELFSHPDPQ